MTTSKSEAAKTMWQNPEHRKKMSLIQKTLWQDPVYRAKMVEKRRQTARDPEYREKKRQAAINSKKGRAHIAKLVALNKTPERRQDASRKQKVLWCDPEYYINNSEKQRQVWARPGYKENHPFWKGGLESSPYCKQWKTKDFRNFIKQRDGDECQSPNCWGTGNKLVVHHIDYNKKNCDEGNLITVCNSCNSRANGSIPFPRNYWQETYQEVMYQRR